MSRLRSKLLWVILRGYTLEAVFGNLPNCSQVFTKFLPWDIFITQSCQPWITSNLPPYYFRPYQLSKCCLTMPPMQPISPLATFFMLSKGDIRMRDRTGRCAARYEAPPDPIDLPMTMISCSSLAVSLLRKSQKSRASCLMVSEISAAEREQYCPQEGYSMEQKVTLVSCTIGSKKYMTDPISSAFPWKQITHFFDLLLNFDDTVRYGTSLPLLEL